MFKHILFPVDFSERSRVLRPAVAWITRKFNASLTLLHAVQMPILAGGVEAYPPPIDIEALLGDHRQLLENFWKEAESTPAEFVVLHGEPATLITDFARQRGVDLITMSTHGYGLFRRLLLGSVAAKVLHDARCAVWTAAHVEDNADAVRSEWKRMLCAVDDDEDSVALIRYAADLARHCDATLLLVHALTGSQRAVAENQDEHAKQIRAAAQEEIRSRTQKAGVDVPIEIGEGSVAEVVRRAAEKFQADLVITGRGHSPGRLGRLRSNAYAIIRDSPCPVLSV